MLVKLERDAIYTKFKFIGMSGSAMIEAAASIRQVTQARPNGYRFMPKFKSGHWDGYINLVKGDKFPTGLCAGVVQHLSDAGYPVEIKDIVDLVDKDWDALALDMFDGITLRQYQYDAVRHMIAYDRGVAHMATNSGKTLVIAALAKIVRDPVLVLVTKVELLYQTAEMLGAHLGECIGIIGDGNLDTKRVTVGMIQTLSKRLSDRLIKGWLDNIGCVIFDECHHLPSRTAQDVMYSIPAPMRFGFSGTPLSYDKLTDLVLIGATGEVLITVSNADLIEAEISATPTVRMLDVPDGLIDMHKGAKYHQIYTEYIVINPYRNDLIAKAVQQARAKSTLVLVERIEHGDLLKQYIPDSIFVNGTYHPDNRRIVLDQLRDGDGAIVIATPIFDEGVDLPAVDLLVLAGGGKGHKKLLQRVGRGMRRKEGDNRVTIIDFVDQGNKYLRQHSRARMDIYNEEGFEVIM